MELDVTHMVEDADSMIELSGNQMEHGKDAGRITWDNSVEYGKRHPLLTTNEERETARSYFMEFGAWSKEEIAAWSDDELQGLMCQDVAQTIREMEVAVDDADYQRLVEAGTLNGNLNKGDDGRWYFYVGH